MEKEFKLFLIDYQKFLHGLADNIKKILWVLARNAFLLILMLILLTVIFGEFLFYSYVILPENKEQGVSSDLIKFKEDTYKSVVQEWQNRESIFNSAPAANYQNPF